MQHAEIYNVNQNNQNFCYNLKMNFSEIFLHYPR